MVEKIPLVELFETLYHKHKQKSARYCNTLHFKNDVCRDIEVLGWSYIWEDLESYNQEYAFLTWARYKFMEAKRTLSTDYLKWKDYGQDQEDYRRAILADKNESCNDDHWLNNIKLTRLEREILLHYYKDAKLYDLAQDLGVSYGWLRVVFSRLKKKLLEEMDNHE